MVVGSISVSLYLLTGLLSHSIISLGQVGLIDGTEEDIEWVGIARMGRSGDVALVR